MSGKETKKALSAQESCSQRKDVSGCLVQKGLCNAQKVRVGQTEMRGVVNGEKGTSVARAFLPLLE